MNDQNDRPSMGEQLERLQRDLNDAHLIIGQQQVALLRLMHAQEQAAAGAGVEEPE